MNNIIQTIRHTARAAAVLLLALCAVQTAWAWSGGQGTEADPYKIASAADLQQLATNVNNGTTTYDNVYFKQTANIDMTSKTMSPIGDNSSDGSAENASHRFGGHYDGGGYAISHLTITGSTKYTALFGYVCGNRVNGSIKLTSLKNIVLTDCNIDGSNVSGSYAAGICAFPHTYTTVENCRVSGTIKGEYAAGGITGYFSSGNLKTCFADVTVTASTNNSSDQDGAYQYCRAGKIVGYVPYFQGSDPMTGNYYHADGATDGTGATMTAIGKGSSTTYPDDDRATPVYTVTAPGGLNVSGTPAVSFNGTDYFAAGTTVTLTTDGNHIISALTVSGTGATYGLAADKKSMTVTVGTQDVTVSATLQTVSGTTADGLTWSLAQDDSGNYTRLTVGGNGAMQNYGYTTVGGLWRTTAPWGYGLTSVTIGDGVTAIGSYAFIGCQSLAAATIGSSVATIGQQAFDHCDALVTVTLPASVTTLGQGVFYNCIGLQRIDILHDGAVSLAANVFHNDNALQYITFPSIAALQANTTGNWSTYAAKLRAKFGNQHFAVTTEGGTPAYTITTADDLRNLAAAVNATGNYASTGKTFRQTADIDLASGGNFTPIGELGGSNSFAGTYDGGGHTISGLTVSIAYGFIGLFGVVKGAIVRNVILLSPTVKATTTSNYNVYLGALIGMCNLGSSNLVENCHVVNPTVSSSSTSSGNYVGAIIGEIWDPNTTVTNCYYYGGNANAAYGNNPNGATVTRVCAAHLVTPADGVTIQTPMAAVLGFTCDADNNGTAENYWRTGAQLTLGYTGTVPDGYTIGYTATNGGTISGSTLTMPAADVTVAMSLQAIPWDGRGIESDPYIIEYPSQLLLLAHRVNGTNGEEANDYSGKYFKLGADITFSHDANEGDNYAENYEAIGHLGQYSGFFFKGKFDGDDKTVSGIRLRKTGTSGTAYNCQGLFGLIGEGADIHDVHVTDARIKGYQNVGGIVGKDVSGSSVRNCTVTESAITAHSNYGTICGWGKGTLSHNYYRHCTVNGTAVTSGKGSLQGDVTANSGAVPLYLVTPATGVTIQTAMADDLGFSYDSNNDGTPENYWRAGAELTLATTGIATPAQGYRYAYIYGGNTISGNTLTVNQDATVSAVIRSDGQTHSITYMKADGTTDTHAAIALDETMTSLAANQWYFVGKDIDYTQTVTLSGDVTIILCDGYTMNIGTSEMNAVTGSGIYGDGNNLTIYGQTLDEGTAGQLRIYISSSYSNDAGILIFPGTGTYTQHSGNVTINSFSNNAINVYGDITINGGKLDATATAEQWNSNDVTALACSNNINMTGGILNATGITSRSSYSANGIHGAVTMTGGTLTASGTAEGKNTIGIEGAVTFSGGTLTASATSSTGSTGISGNVSLSWTNAADRFTASSYDGTVTIADGQAFTTDGTDIYSGTLSSDVKAAINGKTLQPSVFALAAREAPDGNYWTTYYNSALGFTIDDDEHACAYTATYGAGQLTLHNLGKEIPKNTAVIIVADNDEVSMTATTALDDFSGTNDLRGVDVDTDVDDIRSDLGTGTFYVLGMTTVKNEQHFGFHRYTGEEMAAHKAYVFVSGSQARSLTMVFDEASGIESAEADSSLFTLHSSLSTWFTLDGRRLQAKPTAPGIYINNGKKVVIK